MNKPKEEFLNLQKNLKSIQDKADHFFNTVHDKYSSQMKCSMGCSACCHQQFSIFNWEAFVITEWFEKLSLDGRNKIKKGWLQNSDENLVQHSPCVFLVNHQCSIYETRPLICRTQGLVLEVLNESQQPTIDYCPLNFEDALPEKKEHLNLDTLNTISATLENIFIKLKNLKNNRISLVNLRKELLKKE